MTIGAARRVREVPPAVDVAAQAHDALGIGCVSVAAVTPLALLMLGLLVKARQRAWRVAGRACGRNGNAARSVWSVAGVAPAREFTVW